MNLFNADHSLCTKCGSCIKDCVVNIIEPDSDGFPFITEENETNCFKCRHCLAVCPTDAVSVMGLDPKNSLPIADLKLPDFEQTANFVRARRSIRHYKNENVNKTLLENILKILANSPTGANAQDLTFNVIDDKDEMRNFGEKSYSALIDKASKMPNPHPLLERMMSIPQEIAIQMLFRSAPHAIIVSAPSDAPCPHEDIIIALTYFELLAQSAGLGTLWWGYFKPMLDMVPEMRSVLGIPDGHLYYAMLFGYPDIEFARTAQKEDIARIRKIKF